MSKKRMESQELFKQYKVMVEDAVDVENRRLHIGDIDEDSAVILIEQLTFLTHQARFPETYNNPVQIIVHSFGGSDDAMLYIYDSLMNSPVEIHTVGSGMVCSAATLILACGDKRAATENCWLMTHKGKATIAGDDDEIEAQAELQAKVSDRYWKLLERHTSKSALQWYRKSKKEGELWLDAESMKKWGVIDHIIPSPRELKKLSPRPIKELIEELDKDE